MTEEEAEKYWCPFASSRMLVIPKGRDSFHLNTAMREGSDHPDTACVASNCMAWRWKQIPNPNWTAPDMNGFTWPNRQNPLSVTPYAIDSTTDGYCGLAGRP